MFKAPFSSLKQLGVPKLNVFFAPDTLTAIN